MQLSLLMYYVIYILDMYNLTISYVNESLKVSMYIDE